MRGRLELRFADFKRGVHARQTAQQVVPGEVEEFELASAYDVTYDKETGLIRRRNGHANALTYAPDLNSMFPARGLPAGAASQLILGAGANIYSYTVGGGLTAAIISGLTAGTLMEAATAPVSGGQGPFYMLNGFEARYWTGAVAGTWTASSGTLPLGYYPIYHGNRMWVARMNAYAGLSDPQSGLVWSGLGDPRAWPAANANMFDPNDGGILSGIGRIGPYLLVFKQTKTWLVYDLDTGANRPLSGEIGCISHRSIVETQRGTYFLTRDRGWALCDGSNIKLLEDKLDLNRQLDQTLTGTGYFSHAEFINDRLYAAQVNVGGGLSDFLEYDPSNDAWWPHSRVPLHSCVWDGAGQPELWAIEAGTKTLGRYYARVGSNQRDFANQDIAATFRLPQVSLGTDARKRWRSMVYEGTLEGRAYFGVDGTFSAPQTVNTSPTGTTPAQRVIVPRPSGVKPGRFLQARIDSNDPGAPETFEVAAVTMHLDRTAR